MNDHDHDLNRDLDVLDRLDSSLQESLSLGPSRVAEMVQAGHSVILRRSRRRRRVAVLLTGAAFVVAITIAATLAGPRSESGPSTAGDPGSPLSAPGGASRDANPSLELTEWQMTSFREPGREPVQVTADARFRLDGKGTTSADACNHISAGYRIDADAITFSPGMSTLIGCIGERQSLDHAFSEILKGAAHWSVTDGGLTLSNKDGWELAFHQAKSNFPDADGAVILSGVKGNGEYRLTAENGTTWGANYSYRTAPGTQVWSAGIAADSACLANSVAQADWLDGETFVFGWVTPDVAQVVSEGVEFDFYEVPDTDLRIAAAWVPGFKPSQTAIVWHDRAGAVLAAYPNGPC